MALNLPDPMAWLDSRIQSIAMDKNLSIVERLVKYYRAEGMPIGYRGYEWQIQIVNDLHPRQAVIKRSQVGMTLQMMAKCVALLEQYSITPYCTFDEDGSAILVHPNAIYSFESASKVTDFSSDRLKGFIRDNPFIETLIEEGDVDQVKLKKIGKSSLYLGGRRSTSAVTSIPANIVFIDELDRDVDVDISQQIESRVKASKMFRAKTQRGIMISYSTPEAFSVGISALYDESDQHVFMVKCSRCGYWHEMLYPDSIAGWYEKGSKQQGELYYQCLKCGRPLDWSEIGCWDRSRPLQTKNCEWVPKRLDYYEQVTKYGEGYRGYRVPWAFSQPVTELMRDRDAKSKLFFFHHCLGVSYEEDSTGLQPSHFESAINKEFQYGRRVPGTVHVMGVDQGCYLTIWAMEPMSRGDGFQYGKWVEVYHEHPENENAFTTYVNGADGPVVKRGRLYEVMKDWGVDVAVVDAEPNMASAHSFSREFPGQVYVNHSGSMRTHDPETGFNWVGYEEDIEGNEIFVGKISEDKTSAIDAYFNFIREGALTFAAGCEETDFQNYIKHHTNIRKVIEERSGGIGGQMRPIAVYRAFGADHYGQSGKFAYQASILFHKAEKPVTHLIIPAGISGWKNKGSGNDLPKVR